MKQTRNYSPLSQEEGQQGLAPYEADIQHCIDQGWKVMDDIRINDPSTFSKFDARSKSAAIYSFIKDAAKHIFDGRPNVTLVEHQGLFLVTFDNRISVRFKKLDRNLKPSNIKTHQQQLIAYNLPLEGMPPVSYV